MNFKKIFVPVLAITTMLGLAALPALAGHHEGGAEGKSCPISGGMKGGCDKGGMMGGCGKGGACAKSGSCNKMGGYGRGCAHASSPCPIASKFCKKVCWILEHKEELGLTDDQIAKIKALDLEVEKNSIRGMAEMKIFALEMESRLGQDMVDVEAIESMIDSGMAGMALSAKSTVKAYADLKAIITPEQKAKAMEIKKAGHEGHHHHKS
jgi:hypothetical protein